VSQLPPVHIIYEDQSVLVIDKPAGVVIHPAYKHPDDTLFDAVVAYLAGQGEMRPCLLHRLDKDTSGVVILAKTLAARRALVRQFERRTVQKRYLALVAGPIPSATEWEINAPLRRLPEDRRRTRVDPLGQTAITRIRVLVSAAGYALLLLTPVTGRTHQLRAHLAYAGYPIVGDPVYGTEVTAGLAPRHMLHAVLLGIQMPGCGDYREFTSPVPDDMIQALWALLPEAVATLPQIMQHIHAAPTERKL
jgi:23S rRNA pseudouridine1911/1915/1917 synthase